MGAEGDGVLCGEGVHGLREMGCWEGNGALKGKVLEADKVLEGTGGSVALFSRPHAPSPPHRDPAAAAPPRAAPLLPAVAWSRGAAPAPAGLARATVRMD